MKRILAIMLLTVSIAAFADPPADRRCEGTPNGCGPKDWTEEEFTTVPSPGTFALVALGLTGLIISWKSRK
jgi:hypothetical protein